MYHDPMGTPSLQGSIHGDTEAQDDIKVEHDTNVLPGVFNLPSFYRPVHEQSVFTQTPLPSMSATNMVAPSPILRDTKILVIKVTESDIYSGDENGLLAIFFRWQLSLMSNGVKYASYAVAGTLSKMKLSPVEQLIANAHLQFLFGFILERISTKTDKGIALTSDIMLACSENSLDMADGLQLLEMLREYVQFKLMDQVTEVEAKFQALKFLITISDTSLKRAMTQVQQYIFRMPDVCKGPAMRPYKVILDALPAECKTQKLLLETQLGLSGFIITAQQISMPPWSKFQAMIVATIQSARVQSGATVTPDGPPTAPVVETPTALATALAAQAKTDAANARLAINQITNRLCWFCAKPGHACKDCKAGKCPDCGKMICGWARGLQCMVTHGIPDGQRGADGQPIADHIKKRINEAKPFTDEEKAKRAAAGPKALVSRSTAFVDPGESDPMADSDLCFGAEGEEPMGALSLVSYCPFMNMAASQDTMDVVEDDLITFSDAATWPVNGVMQRDASLAVILPGVQSMKGYERIMILSEIGSMQHQDFMRRGQLALAARAKEELLVRERNDSFVIRQRAHLAALRTIVLGPVYNFPEFSQLSILSSMFWKFQIQTLLCTGFTEFPYIPQIVPDISILPTRRLFLEHSSLPHIPRLVLKLSVPQIKYETSFPTAAAVNKLALEHNHLRARMQQPSNDCKLLARYVLNELLGTGSALRGGGNEEDKPWNHETIQFVLDGASTHNVIKDIHLFSKDQIKLSQSASINGLHKDANGTPTGTKVTGHITANMLFQGAPNGPDSNNLIPHVIRNALMAPDGAYNLLSEGDLWDTCRALATKGDLCQLALPAGIAGFERSYSGDTCGMWVVTALIVPTISRESNPTSLVSRASSTTSSRWLQEGGNS